MAVVDVTVELTRGGDNDGGGGSGGGGGGGKEERGKYRNLNLEDRRMTKSSNKRIPSKKREEKEYY